MAIRMPGALLRRARLAEATAAALQLNAAACRVAVARGAVSMPGINGATPSKTPV